MVWPRFAKTAAKRNYRSMAIFSYALDAPMPPACVGGVLTIGNFDGVHLGHQALLDGAAAQARALACPAIAVTFDPHPSQLLRPDRAGPYLSSVQDRIALLQQHVEHVLILQTSPALLELSAREFFERIIVNELKARALVEGFNFGFGKGRQGTTEVLREFCAAQNVPFALVPPREVLGQPVSSSRVRAELLTGNVDIVALLLGRPYRITGVVGTGQKRGATLGFPTANLHDVPTLLPGDGVYAARAIVDGKAWPAAVNVGPNPTFGENARKVEAHLIGFTGPLYEQSLSLDFVKKIRDTRPFASVQELVAQINVDIDDVKKIL
jgi:riboflavin kinase / FMN adenylyltransferase